MQRGFRVMTMSVLVAAASLAIHADAPPQSQAGEIQLQLGNEFFAEGRYQDARQVRCCSCGFAWENGPWSWLCIAP